MTSASPAVRAPEIEQWRDEDIRNGTSSQMVEDVIDNCRSIPRVAKESEFPQFFATKKGPYSDDFGNLSFKSIDRRKCQAIMYRVLRPASERDPSRPVASLSLSSTSISTRWGIFHDSYEPPLDFPHSDPLDGLLKRLKNASKVSELGHLAEELIRNDERYHEALAEKLPDQALQLVKDEKAGAAAALEVCGRLGLGNSLPAFEVALQKIRNPGSLTLAIAAQRIRLIPIEDSMRPKLAKLVRGHIERWLKSGPKDAARDAFLSVAGLEGPCCLLWLAVLVANTKDADILEASAHAACAVALGNNFPLRLGARGEEGAQDLLSNAIRQLEAHKFEGSITRKALARSRLIETVGVFGREELVKAVSVLADLAERSTNEPALTADRAALLRAARYLTRTPDPDSTAWNALYRAVCEKGEKVAASFMKLLATGPRRVDDRSAA